MTNLLILSTVLLQTSSTAAPEIGLRDTKGKEWTLEKLQKDKVYLVEFWATWCTTCRKIAPIVEAFVKENRNDSFEFLSVTVDTDMGALGKYLKDKKPEYPVLLDPKFKMATAWKAPEIPRMFLVKNKTILWQNTGDVTRAALDKALAAAKRK